MLKNRSKWLYPLIFMVIITPFTPYLDLAIERYFYDAGNQAFSNHPFFQFFYNYMIIPAEIAGLLAGFFYILSFVSPYWKRWRKEFLYLLLVMALGAGFIVHTALKDQWGRPRPRQVIEFGGSQTFRPFYKPNFFHQPEPSKSFPCGHCTMGFYFFAFTFLGLRYGNKLLFYSSLIIALILGFLLGLARMAQGGHFLSDVLVTGIIMWELSIFLDWLLYPEKEE